MTCGVGDGGRRGDVNLRGCAGGKWRQAEANRSHQENKQPNKEINNRQTQHFLNKQEEQSCQQTTTGRTATVTTIRLVRTNLPNEDLLLQNPASEKGVFGFSEMTSGVGDGGRRGDVNLRGRGGGKWREGGG